MAGLSLLYLPADGSSQPVLERSSAFPFTNQPPQRQPRGAAILVVEYDDDNALDTVRTTFGDYPGDILDSVGSDNAFLLPQALASGDAAPINSSGGLCSILKFQGLDGNSDKYAKGYDATSDEISRDAKSTTTIGTWIRKDAAVSGIGNATIIVLVVRPESRHVRRVADSLEEWFQEQPQDLLEMQWNPLLIYVALYNCFNSFTTLLFQYENVYQKVALLQERNTSGIFGRSYQCNKCLVSMSYCQQDILAHKAALANLEALVPQGQLTGVRDPQRSMSRLKQNVKLLKEDLEDFKSKLDILEERIKATLDLDFNLSGERLNVIVLWFTIITVIFTPLSFVASVFSVVETDPLYFFIALMLTLVVSLGVVAWLYSSVMHLGQGLRRRDLHKLIYHIPYKEKLGFPTAASSSSRVSESRYAEEEYHRRHKRPHSSSYRPEPSGNTVDDSSNSSSGSPPGPPMPPPPMPYPTGPGGRPPRPGAPSMPEFIGRGRPVPVPPGYGGIHVVNAAPPFAGRMHEAPIPPGRTSAPEVIIVPPRTSEKRRHTAYKKKKSGRQQSSMGTLSYSRRPVTSNLTRESPAENPPPFMPHSGEPPPPRPPAFSDHYEAGPSTSRPAGRGVNIRVVSPGRPRDTKTAREGRRSSEESSEH